MVIGILVAILFALIVVSFIGGAVKKVMEVVSVIFRFCVGGTVSMLIYVGLGLDSANQWGMLLFVVIGGLIVFALIGVLSSMFRMVGYSVNYFINSFLIAIILTILGDKFSLNFIVYTILLFLFPRIMWISDRLATITQYSHSQYDPLTNVNIFIYSIKPKDWWEDSEDSWKLIPLQIVLASIFYGIGSMTILSFHHIESTALGATFIIAAIAVNVLFDLFVFRAIEKHFFDKTTE